MPRYTKQEFKEMIKPDGRVEFTAQTVSSVPWEKMNIDHKNDAFCDEQVEDGYLLEDIGYSNPVQNGKVITVTVNADASSWIYSEE